MIIDEWQYLVQSVLIGLIFSYLLAKLISILVSFRDENLHVVRETDLKPSHFEPKSSLDDQSGFQETISRVSEEESMITDKGNVFCEILSGENGDSDDGDDWEGVESTLLDEAFSAASAFVATAATDGHSQSVSNDIQLQLYGFYKIATEGPCSSPQPSALKMTARAKWNAWQKLGAMPPEDAMDKYIDIVTKLYPAWLGSTKEGGHKSITSTPGTKGTMGPVLSTFNYEEEPGNESKMDDIHVFAREGEIDNLLRCIESGDSVDQKDSEGRTPLHWAVDRGHLSIVEALLHRNADVNSKDIEGQTPLHYAVVCDREAIAEFLMKQNADKNVKDKDGESPCGLSGSNWAWM